MTVPDPTAPTAEDVIAEALAAPTDGRPCNVCTGWSPSWDKHAVNPPCPETQRVAAVVAAVRAMSPETLAELIGGTIEDDGWTPSGPTFARVVGPWQETPSLPVVAPRV